MTQGWQEQADGSLLRKTGNLRMVIHSNVLNGEARFLLIQEGLDRSGRADALIRSGHQQSVAYAIAAVEGMATRLTASRQGAAHDRPRPLQLEVMA